MAVELFPYPKDELRKLLFMKLKRVHVYNHIIKMCDLLVRGKELIKCESSCKDDSLSGGKQEIDAICEELKRVIASVPARSLIKQFSESLRTVLKPSDARNLRSHLFKFNNSQEDLKLLIDCMDSLLSSYWNPKFYYGLTCVDRNAEPIKDIRILRSYVNCAIGNSGNIILSLILQIHLDCIEISPKRKKELGKLLLEAADTIKDTVKAEYRQQIFYLILRKRSAIQFIFDHYLNIPLELDQSENLDKLNECKEILDELIEEKRFRRKYGEGEKDLEKAGRSRMPPSHTWWYECPKKYVIENLHLCGKYCMT